MSQRQIELELVKRLWAEGLSDAQIAPRLAALRGRPVTRNVIIGIRNRNGISRATKPGQVRPRPRASAAAKARPERQASRRLAKLVAKLGPALPPEPLPGRKLVPLQELEPKSCRWPYGDPKQPGFGFCGDKAVEGLPYCHGHALRAYETPAQRAARAAAERRAIEARRAAPHVEQREEQAA